MMYSKSSKQKIKSQTSKYFVGFFGRFKSRYFVLAVLFAVMMVFILLRVLSLQLKSHSDVATRLDRGDSYDYELKAPRGDIVDCRGKILAYSTKTYDLCLLNTNLKGYELNKMLLATFKLLEKYNIPNESKLGEYLALNTEAKPVFKKNAAEISQWQLNKDLFALYDAASAKTEWQRENLVKTTPQEFFDYLLYDKFGIEEHKEQKSVMFSVKEQYDIMSMRYLLLVNNWLFTNGEPVVIATNVPQQLQQIVSEQFMLYPGLILTENYRRHYTDDANFASHSVGYLGQMSNSQYENYKNENYQMDEKVGQQGLELSCESYLHGQNGLANYKIAKPGKLAGILSNAVSKKPVPGAQVKTTLDIDLQKTARVALEKNILQLRGRKYDDRAVTATSGCVVALDCKTGAVLANANFPDFKVTDFSEQDHDAAAALRVQNLLHDTEEAALLNRGIGQSYAPGSTYKPVTAMAGFIKGTIKPGDTIYKCEGSAEIGGLTWHCLEEPIRGHGDLTLQRALITSCNLYFYKLGVDIGIDTIDMVGKKLGLGTYCGLDIPGEVSGSRPNRALKAELNENVYDKQWFAADTCQSSIGQQYSSYTMLQMARAISGIATGYLPKPHFIREITQSDGTVLVPEQIYNVDMGFKDEHRAAIIDGMEGLCHADTGLVAELFNNFPVRVAAKTGTAEVLQPDGSMRTNAVFLCFAPADDPQIAVASLVEDGTYGDATADIAYQILQKYFSEDNYEDN